MKKKTRVTVSEDILKLIVEGKIRKSKIKKIKYGKYRIVKRYALKEE